MSKVDIQQALDLRVNHNLSYGEIGKIQNVTTQAIHKRLKPLLPTEETEVYKANKADILAHTQLKILKNIDDKRLKKASVNNLAYSFKQVFDAERNELGKPTGGETYIQVNINIDRLRAEREKLEKELEALESNTI